MSPSAVLHRPATGVLEECVVQVVHSQGKWVLNVCRPGRAICGCLSHRVDTSTEYNGSWNFRCGDARDFAINDFCFCYGITKELFVELISAWLAYHEALECVSGPSINGPLSASPVDQNRFESLNSLKLRMGEMVEVMCRHCRCDLATCTANVIRQKQLFLLCVLSRNSTGTEAVPYTPHPHAEPQAQ